MSKYSIGQVALAALAAAALAGCASKPTPPPTPQPSAATTQAIQDAQMAINNTQEPCTGTGNAQSLLQEARDAASSGDDARAQDLARQAQQAVDDAVNNCYLDLAREELSEAQGYSNLSDDQMQRLDQGQQAIDNSEGRRAYEILSQLNAELQAASMTYDVRHGDTLWGIAGQQNVYGNPWEWPLIYKANTDKIQDADLIFPDQQFTIPSYPSQDAVNSAVEHAKNRGQWQVGQPEQSDQDYLDSADSDDSGMMMY
ncbi:MAG TPA: LysM peptidoglycan-binding domain-containing protein [Gammaproteobacteria bacterium]|jgi:nucleoid-associated protein YgaU|nr:LysM peptidoglycan-binding domain-containing protein [Gammaproteobacteria bacterium]HET7588549.1 LysM peptidoglycan-binding domain-containing protein [Gammaproteobacteria bacterium]